MNFRVGQKVTMAREAGWLLCDGEVGTVFGAVYTVRAIHNDGLRFHEIHNPSKRGRWWCFKVEGYFWSGAFRPVVEPKIELPECLTALLDPAKHEIFEDAR